MFGSDDRRTIKLIVGAVSGVLRCASRRAAARMIKLIVGAVSRRFSVR